MTVMTFSGGSNGDAGPGFVDEVIVQIRLLSEEITVLRAVPNDDPRHSRSVRVIDAKVWLIDYLTKFLPPVPEAPVAGDGSQRPFLTCGVGAVAVNKPAQPPVMHRREASGDPP